MKDWTTIIKPQRSLWSVDLKEIYNYRDLLRMFVRRDIVTIYKQTVLGPLWFFVQPIMTSLVYIFVFGNMAGLSSDGLPKMVFYLSGIVLWNYFAECFNQTSDTFMQNASIFGKVYFPRIIIPLSKVVSGILKFLIQFVLFLCVFLFYFLDGAKLQPNWTVVLIPLWILLMSGIGLGMGLFFSAMTRKYRDLKFLIQFGVQLMMFVTPIIYPMSSIGFSPGELKFRQIMDWNPFTHIIEGFRYSFTGAGQFSVNGIIYSCIFTVAVLVLGVLIFNKAERNFVDTI